MKFITTFHHEKCGIWEQSPGKFAGHYAGVKTHYPALLADPKLKRFYGDIPREEYLKLWLDKLTEVIDTLIDIVSKHGQLLLNISPKADGTVPEDQRAVLLEMGNWLKVNGEAIYATRPWLTYGEGPTRMPKGGHFVGEVRYGGADVRYTRSKDGVSTYVIVLGDPEGPLTLSRTLCRGNDKASVVLLGLGEPVRHAMDARGHLVIHPPAGGMPRAHAHVFRLRGFDLALAQEPVRVSVSAARATFNGRGVKLEDKGGRQCVGFWDDPADSVHWLLRFPKAGTYQFEVEAAAMAAGDLAVSVAGRSTAATVAGTGDWSKPKWSALGQVKVDAPGVAQVTLRAVAGKPWHAVNVFGLRATLESP